MKNAIYFSMILLVSCVTVEDNRQKEIDEKIKENREYIEKQRKVQDSLNAELEKLNQ